MNERKKTEQTWGTSVFKVGPEKETNTEQAKSYENVIKTRRREVVSNVSYQIIGIILMGSHYRKPQIYLFGTTERL